jgi:phosphate-selective porin OprO/OprP
VLLTTAPEAELAPLEPPVSGETPGPAAPAPSDVTAPPVAAPAPEPEAPAPATAPAPLATITATPAPEKPPAHAYVSPPAVGKTESTVANAKLGDESDVAQSRYKIGKGYTLSSKDGRFSLQIRGRMQFRYDVEHYNAPNADGMPKDTMQSLQMRRMRLLLQGTVFSPYVKYHLQFGFSPRDMQNDLPNEPGSIRRNPLRDARIEFDRLRDFTVWMGQFKVPFSRQRIISSAYMNLVDRSIVNAEFNLDRDIGFQVMSKDLGGLGGRLAYYAGVFMGEGRNAFDLTDSGLLYVGRFEVNPFGKFDDYSEGDLARSKKPGLSIAGAYAYQDRAHAARGNVGDYPADRGTTNFHHVNADVMFKWQGLTVQTALHLRKGFNRKPGGAVDDTGVPIPTVAARQGLGWYAQVGYVVPKIPLEVVGRYSLIRNNYGTLSSLPDQDEAGGGLNWYFVGHDLKLQVDYFRLWDQSMGTTNAERARNGTDRVRLQVQVYF